MQDADNIKIRMDVIPPRSTQIEKYKRNRSRSRVHPRRMTRQNENRAPPSFNNRRSHDSEKSVEGFSDANDAQIYKKSIF